MGEPSRTSRAAWTLAVEVCFPICRSELVHRGLDPTDLRSAIDALLARRSGVADIRRSLGPLATDPTGEVGHHLVGLLSNEDVAAPSRDIRDLVVELLDAGAQPGPSPDPKRARLVRRLDDTIDRASAPDVDLEEVRVHGALIGVGIDETVFETAAYSSDRMVGLAVELDCAARLLPWRDRFDAREGNKAGGGVIRAALSAATTALAQVPNDRDRVRIDRQLQDQFIDTRRYRDGDWIAWLASRATDCAYAAVGSAFGKPSAPSAIAEARAAAIDHAAVGRGMQPWDLEATLRTEVDAPVLDELGAQHRALDLARLHSPAEGRAV